MIDYKFNKTENVKDSFNSLYDIVECLRDPKDGCPWDKEQKPVDIIRSLQGEIYEYIDALSDKDKNGQKEELGDIFLNIFLLIKIHDQDGDFKASDCIIEACEKYIRRHPHVFSNVKVDNSNQVINNWQNIKKNVEGRTEDSNDFFAKVERNAPELERCYKISKKAAKVGFEWLCLDDVFAKVNEELDEVKNATDQENLIEELGDVLFAVVNLCRYQHIKPQDALQKANYKFINRFNVIYKLANEKGVNLEDLGYEEFNRLWSEAKKVVHV